MWDSTILNAFSVQNMSKDNALHDAAKKGDLDEVKTLVTEFDINALGKQNATALYYAADNGHVDVVEYLLSLNPAPDVNLAFAVVTTFCMICLHDMYFSVYHDIFCSILFHLSTYWQHSSSLTLISLCEPVTFRSISVTVCHTQSRSISLLSFSFVPVMVFME